jgi:hypothetical protein
MFAAARNPQTQISAIKHALFRTKVYLAAQHTIARIAPTTTTAK